MPARGNYKSAAAVAAIGIPKETFNRWLDRKVIGLAPEDIPGDGRGKPRRFSQRTIVKLAIAHKISLLGVPANIAVALASKFTDVPQYGRPIGGCFPVGRTVLLVTPDGAGTIRNIQPDGDLDSLFKAEAAVVVDIGAIISNLHLRLATFQ
ncbi:hypothetical protein [Bradyrhizobium sp. AZCC 2230]|uniref:hypothetical protein n=1 Tax=Bradyrhizobium sp. AZCC 2230 TaxID=3117021 RepID=UPI002FEF1E09